MDRPCEVCGGRKLEPIGGRTIPARRCVRCDSVSLVHAEPSPYEESYFAESYLAVREERVTFLRRMLAGLDASSPVVDIGAGAGFALEALDTGETLVAVDASEAATRLALGQGHLSVRAEAGMLPFREGSAPTVLLLDVLAHVASPRSVLADAVRVLARDGTLVVKTPYRPSRVYRLASHLPTRLAVSMTHSTRQLHALSPRGLELALEGLGVDVVKSIPSREALGLRARWRAGARGSLLADAVVATLVRYPSWLVWARKR